jgi:hypothetical protein
MTRHHEDQSCGRDDEDTIDCPLCHLTRNQAEELAARLNKAVVASANEPAMSFEEFERWLADH